MLSWICLISFSDKFDVLASSSSHDQGIGGVVVRVASTTTEAIYSFLQHQLAPMEQLIGAAPYL